MEIERSNRGKLKAFLFFLLPLPALYSLLLDRPLRELKRLRFSDARGVESASVAS